VKRWSAGSDDRNLRRSKGTAIDNAKSGGRPEVTNPVKPSRPDGQTVRIDDFRTC
jgi:hypothetical protein